MNYFDIATRLTGEIPDTPMALARTKVQDGLGEIYDQWEWSFTKAYGGWLPTGLVAGGSPANVSQGTFTVTPYQNTVIADAVATLILQSYVAPPFLTSLQYRDPARAIYSIVGYDDGTTVGQGNPPFATLTLDRPWMENTSGPGQPYMIYQCYFPAPAADFTKFVEVRDTTRFEPVDFWSISQKDLAMADPQRTTFSDPRYIVDAGADQRAGSATLGWPMFELYPHQLSYVPYSFSYRTRGPIPQTLSDFRSMRPTNPITSEMVEFKSKESLCMYKAMQAEQKEANAGRGWMTMAGYWKNKYGEVFDKVLAKDLNLTSDHVTHVPQWAEHRNYGFSNRLGGLNLGGYR